MKLQERQAQQELAQIQDAVLAAFGTARVTRRRDLTDDSYFYDVTLPTYVLRVWVTDRKWHGHLCCEEVPASPMVLPSSPFAIRLIEAAKKRLQR